jgi:hypothetical protein
VKGFSALHNFQYESNGIRVWKAYRIGKGKFIKNDSLFSLHLEEVVDGQCFFENSSIRELPIKERNTQHEPFDIMMYECPRPACQKAFEELDQLEIHQHI